MHSDNSVGPSAILLLLTTGHCRYVRGPSEKYPTLLFFSETSDNRETKIGRFFSVWLSKLLAGGNPLSVGVWQALVGFPFLAEHVHQRFCIKFCQILGDTQAQIDRKIRQAFGNNTMGRTQRYDRFKRLKHDRISSDRDKRTGRPSTSWNPLISEQVRKLIRAVRPITVL